MIIKLYFIPEEPTNTTESLNELVPLLRFVSNELYLSSVVFEVVAKPFSKVIFLNHIIV